MIRRACCAVALAAFVLTTAFADTYLEKVKGVDVEKNTLTITVDGKEKTLKIDDKAEFKTQVRGNKRGAKLVPLKDGLKGVKAGDDVTLKTERKGGAEVITQLVVNLPEK